MPDGKQRRMPERQLAVIATAAEMDELLPEWKRLFYSSATPNPFAHPLWITTWARHFIKPSQLHIVTVRDDGGVLIAVAPLFHRRITLGPGFSVTVIQLMGTGPKASITELSQVLIQRGMERWAMRLIVRHLGEHAEEWDWIELVLPPEQGWFEPQWLPDTGPGAGSFVLHKATRPCVVLPLPESWEALRSGMKRNIKESLRHGVNSLKRAGHSWEFSVPSDLSALSTDLNDLVALHQARARLQGKVHHSDQFGKPSDSEFLHDVARHMFAAGHLTPGVLRVDGEAAAARLLLTANGVSFFSSSGFAAKWWPYSVATTLMAECLRYAIDRQDTLANLSPGPDVAKLRWSECLDLHQEFLMVGPRRRSRLAFSVYWQLRAAALIGRERGRHRGA